MEESSEGGTEVMAEENLPPEANDSACTITALTATAMKTPDLTFPALKNGGALKNKSFKAGSKINQLADMLAKRSLKVLEHVTSPSPSPALPLVEPNFPLDNGEIPVDLSGKPPAEPPDTPPPLTEPDEVALDTAPTPPLLPVVLDPIPLPLALTAFTPDTSTKTRVKTRSSPRSKKEVASTTDSVVSSKKQSKKCKKIIAVSSEIKEALCNGQLKESVTIEPPAVDPDNDSDVPRSPTFICLFCQLIFPNKTDCLNHEATHTLKRKTKFIKCQFCSRKLPNLEDFKSHAVENHGANFFLCSECDLRFLDDFSLSLHKQSDHTDHHEKYNIFNKKVRIVGALDIDVNCEGSKKTAVSPRVVQKLSPKEKTDEQLYEAEMLFYSHLSGNIEENLSKHLDGKINQQDVGETAEPVKLLALAPNSNGATSVPIARAPSPYQTRSKTPNPLPTSAKKFNKLPNWQQKFWEKYNFPTNYRFEHRFWDKNYISTEKSPYYLKDMSCLDIKTQLIMKENVKKLEEITQVTKEDETTMEFPYFLNLVPGGVKTAPLLEEAPQILELDVAKLPKKKKVKGRRNGRAAANTEGHVVTRRMEGARQRKGSLDLTEGSKMTLRRQASLETTEPSKLLTVNPDEIGSSAATIDAPLSPIG